MGRLKELKELLSWQDPDKEGRIALREAKENVGKPVVYLDADQTVRRVTASHNGRGVRMVSVEPEITTIFDRE
jgi:hypothetical protein